MKLDLEARLHAECIASSEAGRLKRLAQGSIHSDKVRRFPGSIPGIPTN